MTTLAPAAGPHLGPAAVRRAFATPLDRVVATTVGIGAVATVIAWQVAGSAPATTRASTWLAGVLLVLACLGEIAYVRVRHGDSTEDLTLFEAVVVVDVCLLPPRTALVVPIVALALACLVMRRPLVKTLFNLGSYATGTALLVALYVAAGTGHAAFSAGWVLALVIGVAGFAGTNLIALAHVLAVTEGVRPEDVMRKEWRLSAFIALGNVGLGAVAVVVAQLAPVLLPFTALPALALTYAYRAAAREADEQVRSRDVLELGTTLAGRAAVPETVALVREQLKHMFGADEVLLIRAGDDAFPAPADATPVDVPAAALPEGYRRALVARVGTDDGTRLVLAWSAQAQRRGSRPWHRDRPLAPAERALLASVASTLAAAIRASSHLSELTEESAKLKAVVDHASDGIAVVGGDGAVLVWSPAMVAITGIDASGGSAEGIVAALGLRSAAEAPLDVRRMLTPAEPRARVDVVVTRPDGDQREVHVAAAATFDDRGLVHRVVAIAHDVTAQRRLDRLKADFVATVSHELRTPITPIKGYAQLLAARGDEMTPERRRKALTLIEERADHLARLVEDLLLSSRVAGESSAALKVDVEDADLRLLVSRAAAGMPTLGGRLRIDVPPVPVAVTCDPGRVVQCLTNLLSNAEKYSEAGTPVRLVLHPAEPGDTTARVSVEDRGHGIPQQELDRVFDRFHRVEHALTARAGGSGLGLFIARELARAMHGDLTVSSVLGTGSTFTLSVPLVAAAPHEGVSR